MRRVLCKFLIAVVLGAISYFGIYFWQTSRIDDQHLHTTAFDWFCDEFNVTGEQRATIKLLHSKYFPECEDHCVHYADTQHTLSVITEDPDLDNSPEHVAAAARLAELEKEADKRFIDFVYGVAGEMDQEQSKRYLHRMKGWLDRDGSSD